MAAKGKTESKDEAAPKAKAGAAAKDGGRKTDAASKSTASKDGGAKGGGASKGAAKKRDNDAISKPVTPSKELSAVIGEKPMPRGEVVSKIWDYIKSNNLQNPEDRREIMADDKLEAVFGKKKVSMFEMTKIISSHLS